MRTDSENFADDLLDEIPLWSGGAVPHSHFFPLLLSMFDWSRRAHVVMQCQQFMAEVLGELGILNEVREQCKHVCQLLRGLHHWQMQAGVIHLGEGSQFICDGHQVCDHVSAREPWHVLFQSF